LEYSSDLSYHDPLSAREGQVMMILISDLKIHPSASEAEVLTDVLMEGEEGTSTEGRSMSPLHQEEEGPPIVSREELDLMTRILDNQPILGNAVSGQLCIRSAGSLPLSKYHPYVRSSYFKGQLQGLPSSEAFCSNYLQKVRTGRIECQPSEREADNKHSGTESIRSSVELERSDDLSGTGVDAAGNGHCADPTALAVLAGQLHGDGRGIGWSWNFSRRDLG